MQRLERARTFIDDSSGGRFFLVVLAPVLAIYLATASWTSVASSDPYTNMMTAWQMANNGTVVFHDLGPYVPLRGQISWIVEGPEGQVSQYPPGAAMLAVPLYAVDGGDLEVIPQGDPRRDGTYYEDLPVDVLLPPLWPGAAVGAVTAAVAVALAALTARPFAGAFVAAVGAWVYAFGTGTWAVAADDLWQHGPAMLWIALGLLLVTRDHPWLGGLSLGLAILTRPPTAIIAAAIGLASGIAKRSVVEVAKVGAGAVAGLAALVAYNAVVLDTASITGGYGAAADPYTSSVLGYVQNVLGGLFDPARGLLFLSPFLIVAVIGAIAARGSLRGPAFGGLVGGGAYLVVMWGLNRYSGGSGFVGYRYPLEAIAAGAPALIGGWEWIAPRRVARLALRYTAAFSIGIYTIAVLLT